MTTPTYKLDGLWIVDGHGHTCGRIATHTGIEGRTWYTVLFDSNPGWRPVFADFENAKSTVLRS